MARKKTETAPKSQAKLRPTLTPQARENRLISLAVNLAEQQLMDGTASSQVISYYLKLASSREKMEQEKLRLETELVKAKTDAIQAQKHADEVYEEALRALRRYSGGGASDDYEDE